jgi:hypothetical protein
VQACLALGLAAAVQQAEEVLSQRRHDAVQQLVAKARDACDHADAQAQAACGGQRLRDWSHTLEDLAPDIGHRGVQAAVSVLPAACDSWPPAMRGWLDHARQAAELELDDAIVQTVQVVSAHLRSFPEAAQLEIHMCGSGSTSSSPLHAQHGEVLVSSAGAQQGAPSAAAGMFLAGFQAWQALQREALPLVERAVQQPELVALADQASGDTRLDLSDQGPAVLELLASRHTATRLHLSRNDLTR